MTAQRWWVKVAARWMARVDGVSRQIRMVSLGVTAFSTFSLLLQSSGHGELIMPLGVGLALGSPVYIYLFTEGGVWNQVARDRRDLSNNFAGPNARISNEMLARSLAAWDKGDELSAEERELLQDELNAAFFDLRHGVELDEQE